MTDVLAMMAPIELIDQLADLKTRADHSNDAYQKGQLFNRLKRLQAARDRVIPRDQTFLTLVDLFERASSDLSELRADMHRCEQQQDFGPGFTALTRSYLAVHDERERIRNEILTQLQPVAMGAVEWPDRQH